MIPEQPAEVVLAERRYWHADGREVVLRVRHGPAQGGGAKMYFWITAGGPDNEPVRGVMYCTMAHDRPQARRVWVERARQLRSVGYEPVPKSPRL